MFESLVAHSRGRLLRTPVTITPARSGDAPAIVPLIQELNSERVMQTGHEIWNTDCLLHILIAPYQRENELDVQMLGNRKRIRFRVVLSRHGFRERYLLTVNIIPSPGVYLICQKSVLDKSVLEISVHGSTCPN